MSESFKFQKTVRRLHTEMQIVTERVVSDDKCKIQLYDLQIKNKY